MKTRCKKKRRPRPTANAQKRKRRPNPLRVDPTRTAGLRRAFIAELNRRFSGFKAALLRLVVDEDAFGLLEATHDPFSANAFCATGPGGGIDPTCSPGGGYTPSQKVTDLAVEYLSAGTNYRKKDKAASALAAEIGDDPTGDKFVIAVRSGRAKKQSLEPLTLKTTEAPVVKVTTPEPKKEPEKPSERQRPMSELLNDLKSYGVNVAVGDGVTDERAAIVLDHVVNTLKGMSDWERESLSKSIGRSLSVRVSKGKTVPNPEHGGPARAYYDPVNGEINIASDLTDRDQVRPTLGSYKVGNSMVGTIRHEFGHAVSKSIALRARKAGVELAGVDLYKSKPKSYWEKTVSGYGSKNIRELMAESYAAWKHPGYGTGKQLPPEIVRVFEAAGVTRGSATQVTGNTLTSNAGQWRFHTSPQKLKAFQDWIRRQVGLRIAKGEEDKLWQMYIEQGWKKGMGRAFDDVKGVPPPTAAPGTPDMGWYAGTRDQFLRSSFNHPVSVEKVKLLAERSYTDLKNVTDDMATRLGRTLVDGLIRGDGPRQVARQLVDQIDVSQQRATVIARTEIIRAHAEGQLTALEEMGIEEVGVAVEWSTTGDERVCELCAPLEGVVLKVSEARGMLPRHANCRCAWKPANVGEPTKGQKRTKDAVQAALSESGLSTVVSDARPESILNHYGALDRFMANAFCATGPGGGVDPTCSPGSGSAGVGAGEVVSLKGSTLYRASNSDDKTVREAGGGHQAIGAGTYFAEDKKSVAGYGSNTHSYKVGGSGKFLHVKGDKDMDVIRREAKDWAERGVKGHMEDVMAGRAKMDATRVAAAYTPAEQIRSYLESKGFAGVRYQNVSSNDHHDQVLVFRADSVVANAFCATGPGGGIDPTCGKGGAAKLSNTSKHVTSLKLSHMNDSEKSAVETAIVKSLTVDGRKIRINSIEVGESDYSAHYTGFGTGSVVIGKDTIGYARDHKKIVKQRDEIQRDHGTVNTVKELGKNPADVLALEVAHELGHHVEAVLQLNLQKAHRQVVDAGHDLSEKSVQRLSGYATVNLQERFAEAHALISLGRGNLIPEPVRLWYEAALRTADPEGLKKYIITNTGAWQPIEGQ